MAAGATYEPIATQTLASAVGTITFSSIPSTYTDLRVVFCGIAGGYPPRLTFNNTTSTYSSTELYGRGVAAGSLRDTGNAFIYFESYGGSPSAVPAFYSVDVFSYAGSTYKTCLISASEDANGSGYTAATVGLWSSTAAINRLDITIGGTFSVGTMATIYGIKAA